MQEVRIGSANPELIKYVHRFKIEQLFNRQKVKRIRPSSGMNYEKGKSEMIEEIIKGQEKDKNLKAI